MSEDNQDVTSEDVNPEQDTDSPNTVAPEDNKGPEDSGAPTTSLDSVEEEEAAMAAAELDALKSSARLLGISFHPSIGYEKLQEKVSKHKEDQAQQSMGLAKENRLETNRVKPEDDKTFATAPIPDAGPLPAVALTEDVVAKMTPKQKATALVRINITCMDPSKKEYESEIFSVGNAVVGNIKRCVPFNTDWHVERIIYNMIKNKKYQAFVTTTDKRGVKSKTTKLVKAYAIDVLDPLTKEELQELKQRQLMSQGNAV